MERYACFCFSAPGGVRGGVGGGRGGGAGDSRMLLTSECALQLITRSLY